MEMARAVSVSTCDCTSLFRFQRLIMKNVCSFPWSASHSLIAYPFLWHTHFNYPPHPWIGNLNLNACGGSPCRQRESPLPGGLYPETPRGAHSPDSCGWRWPTPVWVAAAGGWRRALPRPWTSSAHVSAPPSRHTGNAREADLRSGR